MSLALELTIRMFCAAFLGGVIGYERELRAKGAGIRTHVLVAMGAALFMLISQLGFQGVEKFDAARIAAGVVGGLGFVAGGIIMKTNNHVSGLTTATGIWMTGAIGLAVGGGMYEMAILGTILLLFVLEILNYYAVRLGEKEYVVVLFSEDQEALLAPLQDLHKHVKDLSLNRAGEGYKMSMTLRIKKKIKLNEILEQLNSYPKVKLESLA